MNALLMYTHARIPTRAGGFTHRPLEATIAARGTYVCAKSAPMFRSAL